MKATFVMISSKDPTDARRPSKPVFIVLPDHNWLHNLFNSRLEY